MELTSRTITLPGGMRMRVREGGEGGTTTLFLHGWAVPGAVWDPVLERWPARAGRVLVPDLRGTGWSSKPREGYALADDVGDVVALIDALELRGVVLVGHSKGGVIAQRVALERPQALRRLVLVSPVPASGLPFDEGTLGFFRSLCGHREGAAQILGAVLAAPVAPEPLARLVEAMATVCVESQLGGLDAFRTANFADLLGGLATPTHVISGGAEQILSPARMEAEVVGKIRGATLELLPGCGHYPQLEAAEALTSALVAAALGSSA